MEKFYPLHAYVCSVCRLVQLGETVGDTVAVVDGVKAGDMVVVQPGPDVRDGAQVD